MAVSGERVTRSTRLGLVAVTGKISSDLDRALTEWYGVLMHSRDRTLLLKLSTELPGLTRQVASDDLTLRNAGIMRLQELCGLTAHLRAPLRRPSRRSVLAAGATFAFWAMKDD